MPASPEFQRLLHRHLAAHLQPHHRPETAPAEWLNSSEHRWCNLCERYSFERISRNAFNSTLRNHQQFAAFNHDANYLLGRTTAGTLKLSTDSTGLRYEIKLSDSAMSDHVRQAVERGDLTGSSFSFMVDKQTFHEEHRGGKPVIIRTIDQVTLLETGPVASLRV